MAARKRKKVGRSHTLAKTPAKTRKRKEGRPRVQSTALKAAIAEAIATGEPPDEIAAKHGVSGRTLHRRLAERTKKKPARARPARARPVPAPVDERPLEEDTLVTSRRLLGKLQRRFETAETSREASGLAEKIIGTIGRVEQILARRPPPPRPDAILEELRRLDMEAIAKIEEHLPDPIKPEDIEGKPKK